MMTGDVKMICMEQGVVTLDNQQSNKATGSKT
jgi:hypothetical protein